VNCAISFISSARLDAVMVKGRTFSQAAKSQGGKKQVSLSNKNSNNSSPVATSQSSLRSQKPKTSANVPSCCTCGIIITEETRALQCDRCVSNDVWKCAGCLNLIGELYDHLLADTTSTLHWFCEGCEKAVMGRDNPPFSPQNA